MKFCNLCGARFDGCSRFCRECGAPLFAVTTPVASIWGGSHAMARSIPAAYGAPAPKKLGVAVLLASLFGPLGLLYSSVTGAMYMLLAWCFLVLATCDDWISSDLFPILVIWPVCIIWAVLAAHIYNEDRR